MTIDAEKIASDALKIYKRDVDPSLRCQDFFLAAVREAIEKKCGN